MHLTTLDYVYCREGSNFPLNGLNFARLNHTFNCNVKVRLASFEDRENQKDRKRENQLKVQKRFQDREREREKCILDSNISFAM